MSWRHLHRSTLFMNAFYLMLSTLVVAAAGFVFWVVVAHSYDTAAVGLATALLSTSGLLSLLGLAGFDTTFVRFLPRSDRKADYLNSGFLTVTLLSGVLALGAAVVLPLTSPNLAVLSQPGPLASFGFFTVVTALNTLTNAVFLAYKQARSIFLINALLGVVKVALPLVVAHGDAMTIFGLAGSAQLVGLVVSLVWLRRSFGYTFAPRLDLPTLRLVKKFSFSVYTASILNLLPPTLLPLVIVQQLGPKPAAYYYMAFTIAGVLYTIAYASMQSVFAEGSHDETAMHAHLAKTAKLMVVVLLPAAILTTALSRLLLTTFGPQYAAQASPLLQIFALAALPVAVYSALGAVFKVTQNLCGLVWMNAVYGLVIVGASSVLVPHWGLMAVGWAWLWGNLAACGTGALFLMIVKRKHVGG